MLHSSSNQPVFAIEFMHLTNGIVIAPCVATARTAETGCLHAEYVLVSSSVFDKGLYLINIGAKSPVPNALIQMS